jgi:hypothetical protein
VTVVPDAGVPPLSWSFHAFDTPTKWRNFHDIPIQVVESIWLLTSELSRPIGLHDSATGLSRETNVTQKQSLESERPIAKSYSDPRNEVLAE